MPISWSLQSNSVGGFDAGEASEVNLCPRCRCSTVYRQPIRRALAREKKLGALGHLYQELVGRDTTMPRRTAPKSSGQKQAKEPPTVPKISSSGLDGAKALKNHSVTLSCRKSTLEAIRDSGDIRVAGLRASGYSGSMFCCWQCNPPSAT